MRRRPANINDFEVQYLANDYIAPALTLKKNSTCYPRSVFSVSFSQQTTYSSLLGFCNGGEICLL